MTDKVDLGLIDMSSSENISLAHDIYYGKDKVVMVYIDEEGVSYRFNRYNMTKEVVTEWIEKK